ncbi:hypothetical protein D4764_08G0009900 [Takifugu flavidus]|uniref:Uncharacterized protein n=1 Tax=Takifugu flavidus TaxID=433684 RepID=A0A5C6MQ35_9TELE|nr:hypothetical protein D4764_08G0009900 [Takifugu flavidus]
MDFCFRTFAALFLLFGATTGAPVSSPPGAWADVRTRSQELYHDARRALLEALKESKAADDAITKIGWIESEDKCDPENLRKAPESCLAKIFTVSLSYSSALERFSNKESCPKLARTLIPTLGKLQKAMANVTTFSVPPVVTTGQTISSWEQEGLCLYTLNRLHSFSILTARIFAVGNPAHHMADSPQKCA